MWLRLIVIVTCLFISTLIFAHDVAMESNRMLSFALAALLLQALPRLHRAPYRRRAIPLTRATAAWP